MNCSYDEFDVHNVAPLDIHAYITTTPYPGTQLFQHHWIASHVHVYFWERIRLHDIVHLDDMSVFAQSYRGKFIGISRLREGWADIKIHRQGPGKAVPYILTIPTDFIQLSMFWRLKLKYLERLRPNHFHVSNLCSQRETDFDSGDHLTISSLAGFEPMQTDLDSAVSTAWLRPVRCTPNVPIQK
ncbi:uncharacterized protein HD556DRAFT_1440797 [Suillus plorans]|uniref:Uncharacterized protein n=1 Tax=Suillus plorans TaxID=116603 RepID=A0A9P7DLN0_9AGAM|nr:uncharacterized protein HD556DRAFT_1440797 [Suillus plorans]KAG1797839.1 hypothetical protein HD556DRAFT_1440797 [Suillus plorans]